MTRLFSWCCCLCRSEETVTKQRRPLTSVDHIPLMETDNYSAYMSSGPVQRCLQEGLDENLVREAVQKIITEIGASFLDDEVTLNDVISNLLLYDANSNSHRFRHAPHSTESRSREMIYENQASGAESIRKLTSHRLDPQERLQLMEKEQKYLVQRLNCSECKIDPVNCICLPCGHVVMCQTCAGKVTHCVTCQEAILGTAHVFFS